MLLGTGAAIYLLLFCVCAAKALVQTRSVRPIWASATWGVALVAAQLGTLTSVFVLGLPVVLLFAVTSYKHLGRAAAESTIPAPP